MRSFPVKPAWMVPAAMTLLLASAYLGAATFNVTNPTEFQTALTTAQANGLDDTINVAAGTYSIGSTLTYTTSQDYDLTIVGAGASTTLLDGGGSVPVMRLSGEGDGDIRTTGLTLQYGRMANAGGFGGGLFILNSSNGSIVVDHCTVTNSSSVMNAGGAWLGAVHGDITVTQSYFTHNTCDNGTSDDGCGLYLYFDSEAATGSAIVRNNVIGNNTLNDNESPVGGCDGAGMMIYHLGSGTFELTVEDNIIRDNTSIHGVAGIVVRNPHYGATLTISGNTFSGNIAGGTPYEPHPEIPGGAAHIYSDGGTMIITDNKFLNNELRGAYVRGAGLCVDNFPSGTFQMAGNVFAGNTCAGNGGGAQVNLGAGVTSASIVGNLFVNNQANLADGGGGGLSLNAECNANLANNTFYDNSAAGAGGLGYYVDTPNAARQLAIANDVYWGNTPDSIANLSAPTSGAIAATYSNIEGGTGEPYFGTGCIDTSPLFFNTGSPAGADGVYGTLDDGLHLTAESPSSNTGSNAAVPGSLTTDLAGQTRVQNTTVDMGAYEGVAGTPTAYDLTLAVSPDASGTTTPAAGTHSLTSPQSITATPAGGYTFVNWTATGSATVTAPNSASTSVTFTGDCTVTALIPLSATLTLAVSPGAGGTTTPTAGAHTVNTNEAQAITATPGGGYSFVNWTSSGSVVIGNASSASTTATLTGDATVTANFVATPTDTDDLVFIHHSVGQNWLDNSLRTALDAKTYVDEVNEITYSTTLDPDTGRPASLGDIPGDTTDVYQWILWFNDYLDGILVYGCSTGTNRIVMFKSCYPNSGITGAGTAPGDPFDSTPTITNYQAVFRHPDGPGNTYTYNTYTYHALEDIFAANPDILFIPVTSPPLVAEQTTAADADRARDFNNWLKGTWLTAYHTRTGLDNVAVFDLFDDLANPDDESGQANMQKAIYVSGDPSHPNDTANAYLTTVFATDNPNFIDSAWTAFNVAPAEYELTMAVSPGAGGTTSPTAGAHTVASGQAIVATPATGYSFVNWTSGGGATVTSPGTASTTVTLTAAGTVTANFAINPYTLTYNAGAHGAITGSSSQTVDHGGSGTAVTAVPDPGWAFTQWSDTSTANPRTDTSVTANVTVTAQYAATTATVSFAVATSATGEDAGAVGVQVQLSEALGVVVAVPFTLSGTATQGVDYTVSASPVTIPAGQTQADITVTVTDDDAAEWAETVIITLGTPTNAGLGAITIHTKTLSDEDSDADGMSDDWEQAIAAADADDAIVTLADVLPDDDFDRDGMSNKFELDRGTDPTKYVLTLKSGWNLVSLATLPADNSVEEIFDSHIRGPVWVWVNGAYVKAEELLPHLGYWVYAKADVEITIEALGR